MKLFMNEKKGMEMSMNVIIIAVIAILILVIMVFLIGSRTDKFITGTKCAEAGGRCMDQCSDPDRQITTGEAASSCPGGDCCRIVPGNI